uniref:CCHC-type domain-containing protein n=1 Tax=Cannabis sativa TaxID=3483 RepID=A0A803PS42_CANSA
MLTSCAGVISVTELEPAKWFKSISEPNPYPIHLGFGSKELSFNNLCLWIRIHFLPPDFFTRVNANLIRAQAGKVRFIELDESKPFTWNKWIRVKVEIDVTKPLFCGCFFKLLNGESSWVQIKYENIGHFCYFCGRLGHQRGECTLGSPVTILNEQGTKFPLFGPWLNFGSSYASCFSGNLLLSSSRAKPRKNKTELVSEVVHSKEKTVPLSSLPLRSNGVGSVGAVPAHDSRMALPPRAEDGQRSKAVMAWVPKSTSTAKGGCSRSLHEEGRCKRGQALGGVSRPDNLPVLEEKLNLVVGEDDCVGAVFEGEVDKSIHVFASCVGEAYRCRVSSAQGVIGPTDDVDLIGPSCNFNSNHTGKVGQRVDNFIKSPFQDFGSKLGSANVEPGQGCEVVGQLEEKRALSNFFKAQEDYIHELEALEHSGKLKRKTFAINIGVQPSSECNERTTPVKKRRLDLDTCSLGKKPFLSGRRFKSVVRDFPKGTRACSGSVEASVVHGSDESSEEPLDSEEVAKQRCSRTSANVSPLVPNPISSGLSARLTAWKARARLPDIVIPPSNVFHCEDVGSAVGATDAFLTPVEEIVVSPPQEP